MGRWSRLLAGEFLAWLAVPDGMRWLDVGCGTGALTQTILAGCAPASIAALDRSAAFVQQASRNTTSLRARFLVCDAQSLAIASSAFNVAASGLVLNFLQSPQAAIAEMRRVIRPGGTAAVYVWDYAERMEFLRHFWDAAAALDPQAAALDEGPLFPLCRPDALMGSMQEAGLQEVKVRAITVETRFHDFDDYWLPFLGGQGPGGRYVVSLGEERRTALRERLRADLPTANDGSISLAARAWAARGLRPGAG